MTTRSRGRTAISLLPLMVACLVATAAFAAVDTRQEVLEFAPGLVTVEPLVGGGVEVRYPGAFNDMGRPGTPDLPVQVVQLEIPAGTTVEAIRVELLSSVSVARGVDLAPITVDHPVGTEVPVTLRDPSVYASDTIYPAEMARYVGRGSLRGHTIASVHVHPWIYRPVTGELELVTRLVLHYELAPAAPIGLERHRIDPRIEARFESQASRFVTGGLESLAGAAASPLTGDDPAGPGPFQPTFRPTTDGSAVEYVIVTNEALESSFEPLAAWKTRKGVPAVIRTVEWIDATYPNGVDQAERVRFFLRDAYQNWGTLWVLLGGDTDVVPFRYGVNTLLGGEEIPTDYYFQCLDGNWNCDGDDRFGEGWANANETGDCVDLLHELYAGRAPASTVEDAEIFVEKTLRYEIEAANGNGYPASALFLAERLFPSYHGAEVSEPVVAIIEQNAPWFKIVRLYEESASWPGSEELTLETCIDSVNNGFGLVYHVGHGYRNTMSVGQFSLTNSDVDNFANGDRQSFVFAINCSSVSIDFNSIGERWLKNPDGGAFGYYGTSRFAFVNASRDVQEEWFSRVFIDSVRSLGEVCTFARLPLIPSSEFDNALRWTIFALILLGDPELDIYTRNPVSLDVTHDATFEFGSGDLTVSVSHAGSPVDGASVTAWVEGDFFTAGLTDGAGSVDLALPGSVAGECSLTVDKSWYFPYLGTVTLTDAAGPYVTLQSVSVDDDGSGASVGDGDGLADAGETLELSVTVSNGGGGGLTGGSGVLTVDDPGGYLTLVGDTVSYGDIGGGGASAGAGSFVVEIDATAPTAFQPLFTLTLTANEGSWADVFVLPVHRAYVEHYAHLVDDAAPRGNGNGEVEAGEEIWYTIDSRNSGQETAFGVGATLRVLRTADGQPEPLVTIADDQMSFGDIPVGDTVTGDRFEFTLDASLDPSALVLEVIYADGFLQAWGDTLDLVRPGVSDSLRAFGSIDAIRLAWRAPADEDILGYDIFRASEQGGPYTRINPYIAAGSSTYEDDGLTSLTRYFYQVVTRDSSYNAGSASAVFSGTTTPPYMPGWPIELGQQVQSSLQLADVDGDWVYELFTASDFQYGWHADGSEIVDGDNDPRTSGVYALGGFDFSKGFGATTAVGDVDTNGSLEVCNVAWTEYEIYLWNNLGELMPGWPKSVMDDFNWASPVLADLDLDGDLEVIVWAAGGGRLFAWHHDGVEVVDGDNDPLTDGIMYRVFGVSYNYASPAVANLDADPAPEIVFCTNRPSSTTDPYGAIYVINADGTDVPGWPVVTGDSSSPSAITASPVIVDLDGDGSNEIVVASELGGGTMHVLNADGTDFPGWPTSVASHSAQVRVGSPAVGDIDGDSEYDIVYPASDGTLWAWDRNGNVLAGFPATFMTGHDEATQSTPSLGDIDGDGLGEIVFGDENAFVHAYNHDGTPVDGFPILLHGEVRSTPLIWDIDNDGLIEIAVTCWDANVYIWDLPFEWNPNLIPWPMFRHDARNTGYVGTEPIGVGEGAVGAAPVRARILPPYPNPFNPRTRIAFDVPAGGKRPVRIVIFDVGGRLVSRLVDGVMEPGRHEIAWDGRSRSGETLPTGVYFYRAEIGDYAAAGKLTLVK